jgi:hypothetical protein
MALNARVPTPGSFPSFRVAQNNFSQLNSTIKTVTAAAYTVVATDSSLILSPTGVLTLTLPSPAANAGRSLRLKLTTAHTVISASANVVPLNGAAASTAILAATPGKYSLLQSDGTSWQIMAAN